MDKLLTSCTHIKKCINIVHLISSCKQVKMLPQVDITQIITTKRFIRIGIFTYTVRMSLFIISQSKVKRNIFFLKRFIKAYMLTFL